MRAGRRSRAPLIEAVNFHVWQPCNMHCRYCFAQFKDVRHSVLPEGHLHEHEAVEVVKRLAGAGFTKINFAGGEPMLCPWLPELIETAKRHGVTTSVVTNGSQLEPALISSLADILDWLAISFDSVLDRTLLTIGRATRGRPIPREHIEQMGRLAVSYGIRLKINTVVSRANRAESLAAFILATRPERWKVMQALRIAGQNDAGMAAMSVTADEFDAFVARHEIVRRHGVHMVVERCDDMLGSYAMVDPAGRFIDNVDGVYAYSDPILSAGVAGAAAQVRLFPQRFLRRGGRYDWRRRPESCPAPTV
ncbi:viperin family antiviral radical SAM protein [Actinoplanes sp. NPDC049596]|uniref:viperin family antiviral radical SAM protein n=1 Tax=unclassified Actinoplanes TaxID=2626549 RepID=UPI003446F6BD